MSLRLLNDHVFFPHAANWLQLPRSSRALDTGIVTALDGSEERQAHIGDTKNSLSFLIDPFDLRERALLEERILAALKSGKAACPHLGKARVCEVTDAVCLVSGAGLAIGDFLYFLGEGLGEEQWELAEIAGIAGDVVTLTAPLSTINDQLITQTWPIFYGSLKVENLTAVTGSRGPITLNFVPPVDVAAAQPDDCSTGGTVFWTRLSCDQDACSTLYLRWFRSITASTYQVYKQTGGAGDFELVATQAGTSLQIERPLWKPDNYYVIGVRGELESEPSNTITVEAITIERTMRAIQERYRAGLNLNPDPGAGGSWIAWPNRADATPAGKYPADDFYYDQMHNEDGSIYISPATDLVEVLANALTDALLNNYATVASFAGLERIPVHSNAEDLTGVDRRELAGDMPILVVTEGVFEERLRDIVSCICQLRYIVIQGTQADFLTKGVFCKGGKISPQLADYGASDPETDASITDDDLKGDWADLRAAVNGCFSGHLGDANWGDYLSYGELFGGSAFTYCAENDGTSHAYTSGGPISQALRNRWGLQVTEGLYDYYGRQIESITVKGTVGVNLTYQPSGAAKFYYFKTESGSDANGDPVTYPDPVYFSAASDQGEEPAPGANWTGPNAPLGSGALSAPETGLGINYAYTWELTDQVCSFTRSHLRKDGHWNYYA
jgi:hypothetical protein